MSRAIGGYVRRCERVTADQSTVGHLQERCSWCHVEYAGIRSGKASHDMTFYHDWPRLPMPVLRFETFDVIPLDTGILPGLGSPYGH